MARLRHPHVVQVFDIGSEGDLDYIVMELVSGGSLSERLEQLGPFSPEVAVPWTLDVLSALSAAHEAGIIHRDVKPQNVLVDSAGRALLADFGIAMVADDETRRTRTGIALGSMAYMPPEQRLDAARVTLHADVYAAGATLYRLVTGQSAMDLFLADADSPRWEGVPDGLAAVIRRACAEKPSERFPSAAEFAAALAPWSEVGDRVFSFDLGDGVVRSPPLSTYEPTLPSANSITSQGGRRLQWGVLALGLGLAVALTVALWPWAESESPSPPAPPVEVVQPVAPTPSVPAPVTVAPKQVAPAPSPAPPPKPARKPVEAPFGRWDLSRGGVDVTLTLSGTPAAVEAELRSQLGPKVKRTALTGAYDPTTRVLKLTGTGVRYEVDIEPDLNTATGSYYAGERVRAVVMVRQGE